MYVYIYIYVCVHMYYIYIRSVYTHFFMRNLNLKDSYSLNWVRQWFLRFGSFQNLGGHATEICQQQRSKQFWGHVIRFLKTGSHRI